MVYVYILQYDSKQKAGPEWSMSIYYSMILNKKQIHIVLCLYITV